MALTVRLLARDDPDAVNASAVPAPTAPVGVAEKLAAVARGRRLIADGRCPDCLGGRLNGACPGWPGVRSPGDRDPCVTSCSANG